MAETPTEETTKNRSGGVHLPMLPDGWHYQVALLGPDGQAVEVRPMGPQDYDPPVLNGKVGPEHKLVVNTGDRNHQRHVEAVDLGEALRLGAQTARTLRDLAAHEAKAAQAREKLLAGIGQPSPQREDGTLDTPTSLNGVNVESRGGKGVTVGASVAPDAKDIAAGLGDEPARRRPMTRGGLPAPVESVDTDA